MHKPQRTLRLLGIAILISATWFPSNISAYTLGDFVDDCKSSDATRSNNCAIYLMGVIEGLRAEWRSTMEANKTSDGAACEKALFPVNANTSADDQLLSVGRAVLSTTKAVRAQVEGKADGDFAAKVIRVALYGQCEAKLRQSKPN